MFLHCLVVSQNALFIKLFVVVHMKTEQSLIKPFVQVKPNNIMYNLEFCRMTRWRLVGLNCRPNLQDFGIIKQSKLKIRLTIFVILQIVSVFHEIRDAK